METGVQLDFRRFGVPRRERERDGNPGNAELRMGMDAAWIMPCPLLNM
jgi:hypothetical protein